MLKKVSTFALALLLMGCLIIPVAAADRPPTRVDRRGSFNPFAIRPSVRPTVRFSPFSWFGPLPTVSDAAAKRSTQRPAPRQALPTPAPAAGPALRAAWEDDDEPVPTSSVCGYDPPVRSPFRPAPRGSF